MINKKEAFNWPDYLKELDQIQSRGKHEKRHNFALTLIDQLKIKTITGDAGRESFLMVWEDGMYRPGLDTVKRTIEEAYNEDSSNHEKHEIIEKIKSRSSVRRNYFEVDTNFINLKNGIYDLKENKLFEHSPDYPFLQQIPITYDASKDCPNIKKFLNEILEFDDIAVIQEWLGFILFRNYFIKKAIIFVGEKDTGKSTLINLITAFIGEENASGISLQRIGSDDRFSSAALFNKHLNICDDLSGSDLTAQGRFKIATGNSYISGERKFGEQFQFKNYAKLTFACNIIPLAKDINDDAYFSRWIVMQFNKPVAKPDKFLIQKLTTPEELSGLFNWALEGLKRLLEKGEFSYQKKAEEIKIAMIRSGSIIGNFAYDCCERNDGALVLDEEIYGAFVDYAAKNNKQVFSKKKFSQDLPKFCTYTYRKNYGERGWHNISLKKGDELPASADTDEIIDEVRTASAEIPVIKGLSF